jgi:hypothetical protein
MEGSPESNPGAGLFLGSPVLCVSTTLRNPATNKLGFTKSRYTTLGASADSASMPLLKQQKRTMEQRSRQQRRLRPLSTDSGGGGLRPAPSGGGGGGGAEAWQQQQQPQRRTQRGGGRRRSSAGSMNSSTASRSMLSRVGGVHARNGTLCGELFVLAARDGQEPLWSVLWCVLDPGLGVLACYDEEGADAPLYMWDAAVGRLARGGVERLEPQSREPAPAPDEALRGGRRRHADRLHYFCLSCRVPGHSLAGELLMLGSRSAAVAQQWSAALRLLRQLRLNASLATTEEAAAAAAAAVGGPDTAVLSSPAVVFARDAALAADAQRRAQKVRHLLDAPPSPPSPQEQQQQEQRHQHQHVGLSDRRGSFLETLPAERSAGGERIGHFLEGFGYTMEVDRSAKSALPQWRVVTVRDHAATVIEAHWRGVLGWRAVWGLGGMQHREDAATVIEALARGRRGRKWAAAACARMMAMRRMRAGMQLVRVFKCYIARMKRKQRAEAKMRQEAHQAAEALVIQCAARCRIAWRKLKFLRDEHFRKVWGAAGALVQGMLYRFIGIAKRPQMKLVIRREHELGAYTNKVPGKKEQLDIILDMLRTVWGDEHEFPAAADAPWSPGFQLPNSRKLHELCESIVYYLSASTDDVRLVWKVLGVRFNGLIAELAKHQALGFRVPLRLQNWLLECRAQAAHELGLAHHSRGDLGRAYDSFQIALKLREQLYKCVRGVGHPQVGLDLLTIVKVMHSQGFFGQSQPLMDRAQAIIDEQVASHEKADIHREHVHKVKVFGMWTTMWSTIKAARREGERRFRQHQLGSYGVTFGAWKGMAWEARGDRGSWVKAKDHWNVFWKKCAVHKLRHWALRGQKHRSWSETAGNIYRQSLARKAILSWRFALPALMHESNQWAMAAKWVPFRIKYVYYRAWCLYVVNVKKARLAKTFWADNAKKKMVRYWKKYRLWFNAQRKLAAVFRGGAQRRWMTAWSLSAALAYTREGWVHTRAVVISGTRCVVKVRQVRTNFVLCVSTVHEGSRHSIAVPAEDVMRLLRTHPRFREHRLERRWLLDRLVSMLALLPNRRLLLVDEFRSIQQRVARRWATRSTATHFVRDLLRERLPIAAGKFAALLFAKGLAEALCPKILSSSFVRRELSGEKLQQLYADGMDRGFIREWNSTRYIGVSKLASGFWRAEYHLEKSGEYVDKITSVDPQHRPILLMKVPGGEQRSYDTWAGPGLSRVLAAKTDPKELRALLKYNLPKVNKLKNEKPEEKNILPEQHPDAIQDLRALALYAEEHPDFLHAKDCYVFEDLDASFATEHAAARAYDMCALQHEDDEPVLNLPGFDEHTPSGVKKRRIELMGMLFTCKRRALTKLPERNLPAVLRRQREKEKERLEKLGIELPLQVTARVQVFVHGEMMDAVVEVAGWKDPAKMSLAAKYRVSAEAKWIREEALREQRAVEMMQGAWRRILRAREVASSAHQKAVLNDAKAAAAADAAKRGVANEEDLAMLSSLPGAEKTAEERAAIRKRGQERLRAKKTAAAQLEKAALDKELAKEEALRERERFLAANRAEQEMAMWIEKKKREFAKQEAREEADRQKKERRDNYEVERKKLLEDRAESRRLAAEAEEEEKARRRDFKAGRAARVRQQRLKDRLALEESRRDTKIYRVRLVPTVVEVLAFEEGFDERAWRLRRPAPARRIVHREGVRLGGSYHSLTVWKSSSFVDVGDPGTSRGADRRLNDNASYTYELVLLHSATGLSRSCVLHEDEIARCVDAQEVSYAHCYAMFDRVVRAFGLEIATMSPAQHQRLGAILARIVRCDFGALLARVAMLTARRQRKEDAVQEEQGDADNAQAGAEATAAAAPPALATFSAAQSFVTGMILSATTSVTATKVAPALIAALTPEQLAQAVVVLRGFAAGVRGAGFNEGDDLAQPFNAAFAQRMQARIKSVVGKPLRVVHAMEKRVRRAEARHTACEAARLAAPPLIVQSITGERAGPKRIFIGEMLERLHVCVPRAEIPHADFGRVALAAVGSLVEVLALHHERAFALQTLAAAMLAADWRAQEELGVCVGIAGKAYLHGEDLDARKALFTVWHFCAARDYEEHKAAVERFAIPELLEESSSEDENEMDDEELTSKRAREAVLPEQQRGTVAHRFCELLLRARRMGMRSSSEFRSFEELDAEMMRHAAWLDVAWLVSEDTLPRLLVGVALGDADAVADLVDPFVPISWQADPARQRHVRILELLATLATGTSRDQALFHALRSQRGAALVGALGMPTNDVELVLRVLHPSKHAAVRALRAIVKRTLLYADHHATHVQQSALTSLETTFEELCETKPSAKIYCAHMAPPAKQLLAKLTPAPDSSACSLLALFDRQRLARRALPILRTELKLACNITASEKRTASVLLNSERHPATRFVRAPFRIQDTGATNDANVVLSNSLRIGTANCVFTLMHFPLCFEVHMFNKATRSHRHVVVHEDEVAALLEMRATALEHFLMLHDRLAHTLGFNLERMSCVRDRWKLGALLSEMGKLVEQKRGAPYCGALAGMQRAATIAANKLQQPWAAVTAGHFVTKVFNNFVYRPWALEPTKRLPDFSTVRIPSIEDTPFKRVLPSEYMEVSSAKRDLSRLVDGGETIEDGVARLEVRIAEARQMLHTQIAENEANIKEADENIRVQYEELNLCHRMEDILYERVGEAAWKPKFVKPAAVRAKWNAETLEPCALGRMKGDSDEYTWIESPVVTYRVIVASKLIKTNQSLLQLHLDSRRRLAAALKALNKRSTVVVSVLQLLAVRRKAMMSLFARSLPSLERLEKEKWTSEKLRLGAAALWLHDHEERYCEDIRTAMREFVPAMGRHRLLEEFVDSVNSAQRRALALEVAHFESHVASLEKAYSAEMHARQQRVDLRRQQLRKTIQRRQAMIHDWNESRQEELAEEERIGYETRESDRREKAIRDANFAAEEQQRKLDDAEKLMKLHEEKKRQADHAALIKKKWKECEKLLAEANAGMIDCGRELAKHNAKLRGVNFKAELMQARMVLKKATLLAQQKDGAALQAAAAEAVAKLKGVDDALKPKLEGEPAYRMFLQMMDSIVQVTTLLGIEGMVLVDETAAEEEAQEEVEEVEQDLRPRTIHGTFVQEPRARPPGMVAKAAVVAKEAAIKGTKDTLNYFGPFDRPRLANLYHWPSEAFWLPLATPAKKDMWRAHSAATRLQAAARGRWLRRALNVQRWQEAEVARGGAAFVVQGMYRCWAARRIAVAIIRSQFERTKSAFGLSNYKRLTTGEESFKKPYLLGNHEVELHSATMAKAHQLRRLADLPPEMAELELGMTVQVSVPGRRYICGATIMRKELPAPAVELVPGGPLYRVLCRDMRISDTDIPHVVRWLEPHGPLPKNMGTHGGIVSVVDAAKRMQSAFRFTRARAAMAKKLGGIFSKRLDENTGLYYYDNTHTGEVSWDKPLVLQSNTFGITDVPVNDTGTDRFARVIQRFFHRLCAHSRLYQTDTIESLLFFCLRKAPSLTVHLPPREVKSVRQMQVERTKLLLAQKQHLLTNS